MTMGANGTESPDRDMLDIYIYLVDSIITNFLSRSMADMRSRPTYHETWSFFRAGSEVLSPFGEAICREMPLQIRVLTNCDITTGNCV